MKYILPIFLALLIISCNVKKESSKKKVTVAKNSLTKVEISKINPMFLDTTYVVGADGNLIMTISVQKNLDTTYVENPVSGELNMIVSKQKNTKNTINNFPISNPGDTVYVENPVTGKINMVIIDKPTADTFFIPDPKNEQLAMHITTEYKAPDGQWILQGLGGKTDSEMERVSLEIKKNNDGRGISGNDGCNSYFADLAVFDKKRIEIGPISATERECFVAAKYAVPFYEMLKKTKTYSSDKNFMVFRDENGKQLMEFRRKE